MDQNKLLMEAELKALMEVSQDFARGLSTIAARMKVLKSCLDKPHDGHVSRVDRATSPIVFRTDRGTSVSPLRFKSPVKIKQEKVDIHDEIVNNVSEERNKCDITISQTQSISVNSYNENRIDFPQKRKHVAIREEQLMEGSRDVRSPGDLSDASSSATSQVLTMPLDNSLSNLRKSYYVVNPINGLAIPIDVSQINELGLANNPVQQITLQPNQPIEEDILYAMQANHKNSFIDAGRTVATIGTDEQEIFLSSGEENELVIADKVFAARLPPLTRNSGVKKKTNEEKREYNRLRQARYRANQQRRFMESIERDKQKLALNAANNLNSILNGDVKKDEPNAVNRNVLILRKDLIKKTYARGHRQPELQMNGTASRQTESS